MGRAAVKEKPHNPWHEIKHFKPADFQCPCNLCDGGQIDMDVVRKLDRMRERVQFPFLIVKGTSCREPMSRMAHRPDPNTGLSYAVEILCPDMRFRYLFLQAAFEVGFKRIELCRETIRVEDHPDLPGPKCWIAY